jgi:hypothetical protein
MTPLGQLCKMLTTERKGTLREFIFAPAALSRDKNLFMLSVANE